MIPKIPFRLPVDTVMAAGVPTAAELALGVRDGWIGPADAIQIATAKRKLGYRLHPAEDSLSLMLADEQDAVLELLPDLEVTEQSVESQRLFWLFVALNELVEAGAGYGDRYEPIESLFAYFGYPHEVVRLIPWVAVPDGERVGIEAMDTKLQAYLASSRDFYSARSASDLA